MDRSTAANAITGKKEECGEVERDIDRKEMNKGESEEERMRERRVRGSPPTVTVCVAHGRRRFHSQETNRRRSHVTGRVCLHHSRRPHPINALSQQDKHHHRYLKSIPEFFFNLMKLLVSFFCITVLKKSLETTGEKHRRLSGIIPEI